MINENSSCKYTSIWEPRVYVRDKYGQYNQVSKVRKMEEPRRDVCWYCGGQLIWDCDYNPEDVCIEGEGIVTMLHCSNCGANVQYTKIDEDEESA